MRNGDCCFRGQQGSGQLKCASEVALRKTVGEFCAATLLLVKTFKAPPVDREALSELLKRSSCPWTGVRDGEVSMVGILSGTVRLVDDEYPGRQL